MQFGKDKWVKIVQTPRAQELSSTESVQVRKNDFFLSRLGFFVTLSSCTERLTYSHFTFLFFFPGNNGYPVTHFWVHQEDGIYFESKGTHDHFRPQARRATPDRNSNNKVSSSQKGNSEQVENTEDKTEKQEVILIKCADKESHVNWENSV